MESAASTGDDVATWFTEHAGAIAAGVALAAIAALLAALLLYLLTYARPVRWFLSQLWLPKFCRPQWLVKPFAPADRGDTSTAVFLHWLPVPDPDPDERGNEVTTTGSMTLEAWDEAPPAQPDAAALLTGQPGAFAWVVDWARRLAPRRETVIVGQALERCEHGPGVRVIVKTRHGRIKGATFLWAKDLPGMPPLTGADDESEARHALAIEAAAWARGVGRVP